MMLNRIVNRDSRLLLRPSVSLLPGNAKLTDRAIESTVLRVIDADKIKINLPGVLGEIAILSRDIIYEIDIHEEETIYHGRARVIDRYRDEDGDVAILKFLGALSVEQEKRFLYVDCEIPVDYLMADAEGAQEGMITRISMDRLIMVTTVYIEDETAVKVTFKPQGAVEMTMTGTVIETIRLRSGKYQSIVGELNGAIAGQKSLAQWILKEEIQQN